MAYRASHTLIKYDGSARQASWRDPEGAVIRARTREMAASTLNELLTVLQQLEGQQRA
jgi:NIMA-interacting peptidyl-prolyl cis-trans isomerase 1